MKAMHKYTCYWLSTGWWLIGKISCWYAISDSLGNIALDDIQCTHVKLFTQVFSYVANRVTQKRLLLLEEKEDYLSSIWLSTYGHVIELAVMSDCPYMGTSLYEDHGGKCYNYSTGECKFSLVEQHWYVHMYESREEYCCNIFTNKREITSDATGVMARTTSGGFGQ